MVVGALYPIEMKDKIFSYLGLELEETVSNPTSEIVFPDYEIKQYWSNVKAQSFLIQDLGAKGLHLLWIF